MGFKEIMQIAMMFLLPFITVLVPILIGQWYGRKKKAENEDVASVGAVIAAAFGLLAFMLAITFQIAANRYDARKEWMLKEVSDIRTTYLRAGLIPEPYRNNSRNLLVEYVDLRVDFAGDPAKLQNAISRSHEITDSLWKYTEALAAQDRSSEAYSLFTTAVNDVIDAFNNRVTVGLDFRIPAFILFILFVILFFSMLVLGYQFGLSGKSNFRIVLLLSTIFAVVMFLILALDHTEMGLVKINQKPIQTLQKQLHEKQMNLIPGTTIKTPG